MHRVEREIANFTRPVALGGDLESLVGELHAREARRRDLLTVIAASDTGCSYDRKAIEKEVRESLDAWRSLLSTESVADGRQFLREALGTPLAFTADGQRYRFDGTLALGRLIAGAVDGPVQHLWRARLVSNQRPPA